MTATKENFLIVLLKSIIYHFTYGLIIIILIFFFAPQIFNAVSFDNGIVGMYEHTPLYSHIYLDVTSLSLSEQDHIFYHEQGHHIWRNLLRQSDRDEYRALYLVSDNWASPYAQDCEKELARFNLTERKCDKWEEDFAESYSYRRIGRETTGARLQFLQMLSERIYELKI